MFNPSFEQKCREEAKVLAKHIVAMLKVGKEFPMDWEDMKIQLEHHGVKFTDYNFRDAISYLPDDVKWDKTRSLMYLRNGGEPQQSYWY